MLFRSDLLRAFADSAEVRIAGSSCDRVEAEGAALVASLHAAQIDYDRLTGSGHTQGASFWTGPVAAR